MILVAKRITEKTNFGEVVIYLKPIMNLRKMNFAELRKATSIRHEILKKYYDGVCTSYNEETLARICYILECQISDILFYLPPKD